MSIRRIIGDIIGGSVIIPTKRVLGDIIEEEV